MNEISPRPRVLSLEGGCNFRDLGGYRTTDGRQVRWGQVFRSGMMAHFTPGDAATVQGLGIRVVVDLRRAEERSKEPTRWPFSDVRVLHEDHPLDTTTLGGLIDGQQHTLESARARIVGLYRNMPAWLDSRMRTLFANLDGVDAPLLFHCSAGKDRTGFAAALLLEILGVPRETILEDYVLTNTAVDLQAFLVEHHAAGGLTDDRHPLMSMAPDVRRMMVAADADYLEAALDVLRREHGSAVGYVSRTLGLGDAAIERLRRRLLE